MQVPVVGATSTDRAERPVAHPFVLSRPHGTVVAEGTPEQVAEVEGSYTGLYLKPYLR